MRKGKIKKEKMTDKKKVNRQIRKEERTDEEREKVI